MNRKIKIFNILGLITIAPFFLFILFLLFVSPNSILAQIGVIIILVIVYFSYKHLIIAALAGLSLAILSTLALIEDAGRDLDEGIFFLFLILLPLLSALFFFKSYSLKRKQK